MEYLFPWVDSLIGGCVCEVVMLEEKGNFRGCAMVSFILCISKDLAVAKIILSRKWTFDG